MVIEGPSFYNHGPTFRSNFKYVWKEENFEYNCVGLEEETTYLATRSLVWRLSTVVKALRYAQFTRPDESVFKGWMY